MTRARLQFRGRDQGGQWHTGYLADPSHIVVFDAPEHAIVHIVDPVTVGQCTGRKDINDKLIFEGDIDLQYGVVEWNTELSWEGGGSEHPGFYFSRGYDYGHEMCYVSTFRDVDVVGNIHDNPEKVK